MENCEYFQEQISAMIDGALSDDDEAALAAHLDSCPECKAMADALRNMSRLIAEGAEEPPAELSQNVMDAIRQQNPRRASVRRRVFLSTAAVAACAAIIIAAVPSLPGASSKTAEAPMALYDSVNDGAAEECAEECVEECEELPAEYTAEASVPEEPQASLPEEAPIAKNTPLGADVIYDNSLSTATEMHCRSVILIRQELPDSVEKLRDTETVYSDSVPYIIQIPSELSEELMDTGLYEYSVDWSVENDVCLVLYYPPEA